MAVPCTQSSVVRLVGWLGGLVKGMLSLFHALSWRIKKITQVLECLDLDRVEMILPQVHLRNGEYAAETLSKHLCIYSKCYYTLHSHAALQRGISAPSFLTRSSAFAGVGLNIKQGTRTLILGNPPGVFLVPARACLIPSLTVSERSPFDRCFAADCPLLNIHDAVTIHTGVTRAAAPQAFARGRGGRGFRASPNSLG